VVTAAEEAGLPDASGDCAGAGEGTNVAAWRVGTVLRTGAAGGDALSSGALFAVAGLAVAGVVGWSVVFDVPGRLKFCSSRGPTASGAGVLVAAGGVDADCAESCALASPGTSRSPAAANTVLKRKFALIAPTLSR
jgi:hypothetical protein